MPRSTVPPQERPTVTLTQTHAGQGICPACGKDFAASPQESIATQPGDPAFEGGTAYEHYMDMQQEKRGTLYQEIGRGFAQVSHHPIEEFTAVVIYRGEDGRLWVRNAVEFDDGRFEKVWSQAKLEESEADK